MKTVVKFFLFTSLIGLVFFLNGAIFSYVPSDITESEITKISDSLLWFIGQGLFGLVVLSLSVGILIFFEIERLMKSSSIVKTFLFTTSILPFLLLLMFVLGIVAIVNLINYVDAEHLYYWIDVSLFEEVWHATSFLSTGEFWTLFSLFFLYEIGIYVFRKPMKEKEVNA